jgi:long-chain acyl-CoA synthetase
MRLVELAPSVPVGSVDVLPRLAATRWPHRTALRADAAGVTFASLDRNVSRLAAGLRDEIGGEASVVVVSSVLSLDFATAYYATVRSGNVVAPVNPRVATEVFERMLVSTRPRAVMLARTMYERVRPVLARAAGVERVILLDYPLAVPGVVSCTELVARGDLLVEPRDRDENEFGAIAFGSGETRATGLTHGNLKARAAWIAGEHGLSEHATVHIALPSYHPVHLHAGVLTGATQVLVNGPDTELAATAIRADSDVPDDGADHFAALPDGTFRYIAQDRRAVAS